MSLSKLSKLPPEELSAVLNNRAIPLGHRLRLRLISNRWCDIIEDGLKKETSLVVREEYSLYLNPEDDDLEVEKDSLPDALINTLVRLFPTPTELSLVLGERDYPSAFWSKVPHLLAHWATNLKTVKLYGAIQNRLAQRLARALASISGLTSLTLYGDALSGLLPYLAQVLPRLEAFVCAEVMRPLKSASTISSSLSPRCTRLLLDYQIFQSLPGPFSTQLAANLTHLQLMDCDPLVWNCLSPFHGLTSLALEFKKLTYLEPSLLSHLVPFTRLTDIKLLYGLYYRAPLPLPSKKETPLSNIKRLTLQGGPDYYKDSLVEYEDFFKSIGAWFPALSQLVLVTSFDAFPVASRHVRASQGKLSFSVEVILNVLSYDPFWSPDW